MDHTQKNQGPSVACSSTAPQNQPLELDQQQTLHTTPFPMDLDRVSFSSPPPAQSFPGGGSAHIGQGQLVMKMSRLDGLPCDVEKDCISSEGNLPENFASAHQTEPERIVSPMAAASNTYCPHPSISPSSIHPGQNTLLVYHGGPPPGHMPAMQQLPQSQNPGAHPSALMQSSSPGLLQPYGPGQNFMPQAVYSVAGQIQNRPEHTFMSRPVYSDTGQSRVAHMNSPQRIDHLNYQMMPPLHMNSQNMPNVHMSALNSAQFGAPQMQSLQFTASQMNSAGINMSNVPVNSQQFSTPQMNSHRLSMSNIPINSQPFSDPHMNLLTSSTNCPQAHSFQTNLHQMNMNVLPDRSSPSLNMYQRENVQEKLIGNHSALPQGMMVEDYLGMSGFQGHGQAGNNAVSSTTMAGLPVQQNAVNSYAPGWIKAQLSQSIHSTPTVVPPPSYPHLGSNSRQRPVYTQPPALYRANPVDARFRSLYPQGFPEASKRAVAQAVPSFSPVRFSTVVPVSMVRRHSSKSGRRSLGSTEDQVSFLRLTSDNAAIPMETDSFPVPQMSGSLQHVALVRPDGFKTVREMAHEFAARTYPNLWQTTYCVPPKHAVTQHHLDKALVRTREGEFRVSLALEQLSLHEQEHMVIVRDYHYESFLHHITPAKVQGPHQVFVKERVGQLRMDQQFGDFDLLAFHVHCGILVMGLCSVNSNSDVQYILKRVQKTRIQLEKSASVVEHCLSALGMDCEVTRIFCTPNLKRLFLAKVTHRDKQTDKALSEMAVLCCDQLPAQFRSHWFSPATFTLLQEWWVKVKAGSSKVKGQVSPEDMTTLVGCFLCPELSKVNFEQSAPVAPSQCQPLIQDSTTEGVASADDVQGKEPSQSSQRKELDMKSLYLLIGNSSKSFAQYMEEYVDLYYPQFLARTYRVPPFHFNIQKIEKGDHHETLEKPMSKDTRGDEGENRVVSAIEILGLKYEKARPMFIICDFQYNNYLNKLKENMFVKGDDRRPRRAYGQSVRAQHDCLVIHRRHGVIIISVKAVGDNFGEWANSGSDQWTAVKRTLGKVLKQLPREESMVKMVLGDLTSDLPCRKLIALPNLSHKDVDTAVSDDPQLLQSIEDMYPGLGTSAFLCKDELCETGKNIWDELEQNEDFFPRLCRWWDNSLGKGREYVLSKHLYKQIIGRFCGLLSTVEVWSTHAPRVEVRSFAEAVQETGERYSRIVLTQQQVKVLSCKSSLVYLSGPPGTGKTMLLVLRARHWVEREAGVTVIVLNLRQGSRGLPLGHLLHKQISQVPHHHATRLHDSKTEGEGGGGSGRYTPSPSLSPPPRSSPQPSPSPSHVLRVDLDSTVFNSSTPGNLGDIPEGAFIVVDEIQLVSHPVLQWLIQQRKPRALWCAGQFEDFCPPGFEPRTLDTIIRCPPMVQRVLQRTSFALGSEGEETRTSAVTKHAKSYVPSSAPYGLSTDGSRPLFIFHSQHQSSAHLPADCVACGNELASFLINDLHLLSNPYEQAKRRRLGPLPVTPDALSLKDVVVICQTVQSCALITALRKRNLPVSIVTDTANPSVALPTQDAIIFTTPFAMTGLERKIVVYVPFERLDPLKEFKETEKDGLGSRLLDDLKVDQALTCLSQEDHVSLFYSASRCTAQLIILIP